ncbi:predicted protein [Histoplasma mississippiense (nom. inval.)]|uniref:predicted protein n=1 Tax=Ajellomyces capsulatus (strain NAm1 / WU24) TaxID=2059318 RepID=UPI000157B2BD|nr:predicted protein [Histoplasma mississippiense (nom. inval.)]EDN02294.1 predicted protein [Histoplasma mississippiense (nom. inval.)]
MSGPAFEPIPRPSSTDTLIDPGGDHLTEEEGHAVLALLKLSGRSPLEMRTAEIQLSWHCSYPVAPLRAVFPTPIVYYPYSFSPVNPGAPPSLNTSEDFEDFTDSSLSDSPGTAFATNIYLELRNMPNYALESTPPESDSSITEMEYSSLDSLSDDGTSKISTLDEIGTTLNGPTKDMRMTEFSPKITSSSHGARARANTQKPAGTLKAQSAQQPSRRSTRQRKDSRRLIEAKESEKLQGS